MRVSSKVRKGFRDLSRDPTRSERTWDRPHSDVSSSKCGIACTDWLTHIGCDGLAALVLEQDYRNLPKLAHRRYSSDIFPSVSYWGCSVGGQMAEVMDAI